MMKNTLTAQLKSKIDLRDFYQIFSVNFVQSLFQYKVLRCIDHMVMQILKNSYVEIWGVNRMNICGILKSSVPLPE